MANDDFTPLYVASQEGHVVVVRTLVAAGADINKATRTHDVTPLYIASEQGHEAVVRKLVDAAYTSVSTTLSASSPASVDR